MSTFTPARREQMRLRMALQGPSGAGKTFTALTVMRGLVGHGGHFAVIDTEKRAQEYAVLNDTDPETERTFAFGHIAPGEANPEALPRLVADAAREGFRGLIVDSFTHYWSGVGGALDRVDRARDKRAGWGDYRPIEAAMMSSLLTFPGHVIVTMRVKTEYVTEVNAQGKTITRKLGLKADQRDSVDYEFSVIGEMDMDHALTITKTTCPDLVDQRINRPGLALVDTLSTWLGQGEPAPDATTYRDKALDPYTTVEDLRELHRDAKRRNLLGAAMVDEHGDATNLGDLLIRLGRERGAAQPAAASVGAGS